MPDEALRLRPTSWLLPAVLLLLLFGSMAAPFVVAQQQTRESLVCRDVESGFIHVRFTQSPFSNGGILELTKTTLGGGDLVLICETEVY